LAPFGPPSNGAMPPQPKDTHGDEYCFTGFDYTALRTVTKEIDILLLNQSEYLKRT
jgi:hypothetical protein